MDDGDPDDWSEDDAGTTIGACEYCGETRPIQLREDPFVSEGIYTPDPDNPGPHRYCYRCYLRRADDI